MPGKRAALLVGINTPWFGRWDELKFAESDCDKLAAALSQAKYEIPRENIRILKGSDKAPSNLPIRNNFLFGPLFETFGTDDLDLFVFFFAGHGEDHEGRSYLVPVDGVYDQVPETCVPLSLVLERISRVPAKRRLILFDMCDAAGVDSPSSGLPASFAREAQSVREAVVLSACDIGERSLEHDSVKGGVFTHFLCEGLRGGVRAYADIPITVFDVQRYAEERTVEFAASLGYRQRPRFWANSAMIYMTPEGQYARPTPFLFDPTRRTEATIRALDRILAGWDPSRQGNYCVRICAKRSSFAISDTEPGHAKNRQFHKMLLAERNNLIELFRRGASLKVVLMWNIHEYLDLSGPSRKRAKLRFAQLRTFFQEVLADDSLIPRAVVIRLPVTERNLLILGTDYFFEGRQLGWHEGFDQTQVITDPDTINQEIDNFDKLFEGGLKHVCKTRGLPDGPDRNRSLLEVVVKDLDDAISRLTASPS